MDQWDNKAPLQSNSPHIPEPHETHSDKTTNIILNIICTVLDIPIILDFFIIIYFIIRFIFKFKFNAFDIIGAGFFILTLRYFIRSIVIDIIFEILAYLEKKQEKK